MTRAYERYVVYESSRVAPQLLGMCVCVCVCVELSSVYGTIESIFIASSTQLSFTQQLLFLLIFNIYGIMCICKSIVITNAAKPQTKYLQRDRKREREGAKESALESMLMQLEM